MARLFDELLPNLSQLMLGFRVGSATGRALHVPVDQVAQEGDHKVGRDLKR